MSNPIRNVEYKKGNNPKNVVYPDVPCGKRVRAPVTGVLQRYKYGVMIVTNGGKRKHKLSGVKARSKLVGTKVWDGRWIGNSTKDRVVYRRLAKVNGEWVRWSAMPIVKRAVEPRVVKPWTGLYPLTAGKYYSSGAWHGAWDLAMPIGTPLVSPVSGTVVQMNTGVPNNKPGYNPGSGAASNFVVIYGYDKSGRKRTVYLQHMNKVIVKTGQKVRAGTPLGESGNTGNSTGPHLHIDVQFGWVPRYSHYRNHSLAVYPPSQLWS